MCLGLTSLPFARGVGEEAAMAGLGLGQQPPQPGDMISHHPPFSLHALSSPATHLLDCSLPVFLAPPPLHPPTLQSSAVPGERFPNCQG